MNGKTFQPQISQMNADVLNAFISENLRHLSAVLSTVAGLAEAETLTKVDLRLSNFPAWETDKALKEILEEFGV